MIVTSLLGWWYGRGWQMALKKSLTRLRNLWDSFSVGLLFKTLFAPWKQIVNPGGAQQPLNLIMRNFVDNLISRFVGFGVRLMTIIAAMVSGAFVLVYGLVIVTLWPLLPPGVIALVLYGLGVF